MRPSTLLSISASALPLALSAPLSPPPVRTRSITAIPPGLYASVHPSFAGAPIVLSDPRPTAASSPGPGRYAISYTPYTSDGLCKSSETITSDIARIHAAGFSAVRLYATDCHFVRAVGLAAVSHNLSLILGLHISEQGLNVSRIDEQVSQIHAFASEDATHLAAIDAVIVGNEVIFNHFASVSEMVTMLDNVRSSLRKIGYSGPVTTTEPYGTMVEHADSLCPAIDLVAANLLPFFNADSTARSAADTVSEQIAALQILCEPSSDVDIEIAWPSAGEPNGLAVPGVNEQRIAFAGMADAIGSRAVFSSFEDDGWRDAGDFGVETHWGSIQVFE
ncbi:glycoside hydrolase family 17 protein [Myriangium duriaei CBS 260.36]|uniref:Probable beta-glucosidase btgE n=1 Tax=Myriangium duriaei CBS 260.36 TaxID=1168546 RepID=A0A9P4MPM4_9PEZI|nr:glycoside hydrolase family 17 protein [Myriangium duriaei CBS 260.36]